MATGPPGVVLGGSVNQSALAPGSLSMTTQPDMVPLWAAVPKKTVATVPPAPPPEPAPSPVPPPIVAPPEQKKPRRLMLKDEGAVEKIKKWWQYIQQEWKEVIDWCGFVPGSDLEKTAYFMMMGFMTQDTRHIQMVMPGCSRKWLQDRRERARKYGIWCGNGTLRAEWFDLAEKQDISAEVSFLVNVMVVNGDMEVVKQYDHRTGKYELAYRLSKTGLEWAKRLPKEPERLPRPSKKELDRYTDDGNPNG